MRLVWRINETPRGKTGSKRGESSVLTFLWEEMLQMTRRRHIRLDLAAKMPSSEG